MARWFCGRRSRKWHDARRIDGSPVCNFRLLRGTERRGHDVAQDIKNIATKPQGRIAAAVGGACSDDLEPQMFEFWYNHEYSQRLTGRQFNYSTSTVRRLISKHDWDARAAAMRKKAQQALDRKILSKEISNLTLAKRCLKKEVDAYLKKTHKATGNLQACIALMKYIDEVLGNMPPGGNVTNNQENHITYNFGKLTDDERDTQRRSIASAFRV